MNYAKLLAGIARATALHGGSEDDMWRAVIEYRYRRNRGGPPEPAGEALLLALLG